MLCGVPARYELMSEEPGLWMFPPEDHVVHYISSSLTVIKVVVLVRSLMLQWLHAVGGALVVLCLYMCADREGSLCQMVPLVRVDCQLSVETARWADFNSWVVASRGSSSSVDLQNRQNPGEATLSWRDCTRQFPCLLKVTKKFPCMKCA